MKKIQAVRVSAKQKFENYKTLALQFINTLRYPLIQTAFSVTAYQVVPGGKKPNAISAPELGAIVGTAQKLGKFVQVTFTGVDDGGTLNFVFVDSIPPTPRELQ